MTYTGDVVVGGSAQVRELDGLTIHKLAVGPMSNNVYLLTSKYDGTQLLIDPAADHEALMGLLSFRSTPEGVGTIIVTHRHADHIGALHSIATATGARVMAGAADAESIHAQTHVQVHRQLHHGDEIAFGDSRLKVVHLRGHTPGSIALVYQDADGTHIFSGDSLFPGGVGKTASKEDFNSLLNDVETRIFQDFDDATWIYPGHGADTTLGVDRPNIPQWRERGW